MLESLVNNNLLVYDLVTSKNGYSLMDMRQDNQQERLDFGITQKDSVDQKLRMSEDLIR